MFLNSFLLLCFLSSSLSVTADDCGGVLKSQTGEITSPNYPNNYPDDITCTWQISPEKSHVNLTIEDFMLEGSKTCRDFDFVKIKVKKGRYGSDEINVCGLLSPRVLPSIKLDGDSVEITFKSDLNVNARGFKISYRSFDIDPCVENNGDCSHNCSLVKGKRTCSCPDGYKLTYDWQICKDENSCYFTGRQKCPYSSRSSCEDFPDGNTTCVCWNGYRRKNDKCEDIDECREDPKRCGVGVCHNRRGYYYCSCPTGYRNRYSRNGHTCEDADECGSYRPPDCGEAQCVNTPGSYVCQCEPGYKFNGTLKTCQDDDECASSTSGCDHVCSNTNGSFSCSCHPGYFLDSDGKTCRAVKIEGLGRVNSARACQGESLRMSCEDPLNTLIIFKAEFADSGDPAVCPHQKFIAQVDSEGGDPLPCSEDVTKKIKNWCGWRSTCELRANPAISDLCHGPNKFLSVAYSCGKPLKCRPLPKSDSCAPPVKDECKSDKECQSAQMCCFDGCKRVCSEPVLYTGGS